MKALVLGGVRSGKSRIASRLASEAGRPVVCFATARADDEAMRARIASHREARPAHWRLVEEPCRLASAMRRFDGGDEFLLVDCLTLWLTNLLCCEDPTVLDTERADFLEYMTEFPGDVVLVGNETNMGVVPTGQLSRRFCDEAGTLHQELAELCDTVILAVAGLSHRIKPPASPLPSQ